MKRAHRRAHFVIWPLLAIALAIGVVMALVLRPPPEKGAAIEIPASAGALA